MTIIEQAITLNVKFTREYFGFNPNESCFSRLDQALTEVAATNLPLWERRSAARVIADAFATVAYTATNRKEKNEATEYAEKWVDIRNMLA